MSIYPGGLITDTTPDRRRGETQVDIQPDPRISTLRPAWLTDDQQWRDQLQALDLDDDIRWVERNWEMAGGADYAVDTSWITVEKIGDSPLAPIALLLLGFVATLGPLLLLWVR